jgi:hypothetical protein
MKDASNQEIVPVAKRLEVHTNRHPTSDGYLWGWITGCTKNIVWGNDSSFNLEEAEKFVKEYNAQLTESA